MLITAAYREMQETLHQNPDYGVASVHYAPRVAETVRSQRIRELLDYGAGKGRLGEELEWLVPWPLQVHRYDPGVPAWSAPPAPCGFVACIDVLEHIEPELLDNVLDDLKRVTLATGLFTVHTGPAAKILSDGRNAHLIQQPPRWWLPRILERFDLLQFSTVPYGFIVLVRCQIDQAAGAALASSSAATASSTGRQAP
ncbi:MAG: hypothetical protein H7Y16_00585 [Candidatus Parcubacteria bacterium]|nr:hypothetical protein [Burkholderiales bacterium]